MMPTYKIEFWRALQGSCYVEAENEEAARNLFEEESMAFDPENEDYGEDDGIKSIEEVDDDA